MGGRGSTSGVGGGYKTFPDVATSGYTYSGDGSEQQDFFRDNSNFESIVSNVNIDDRSAFGVWARGGFMDGQQYLGWDNMTTTEQKRTQIYDDILDKSVIYKGIVVSRRSDAQLVLGEGNYRADLASLQAMEGKVVTCPANMSFAAASEGLTIGSPHSLKSVEYKLKIPPGAKGAGMWIGDKRINREWGPDQREFMTNRDIGIKVGKTKYDKRRDLFVVELKFDGLMDHDYGKYGRVS